VKLNVGTNGPQIPGRFLARKCSMAEDIHKETIADLGSDVVGCFPVTKHRVFHFEARVSAPRLDIGSKSQ
jgi:hypothetical protein